MGPAREALRSLKPDESLTTGATPRLANELQPGTLRINLKPISESPLGSHRSQSASILRNHDIGDRFHRSNACLPSVTARPETNGKQAQARLRCVTGDDAKEPPQQLPARHPGLLKTDTTGHADPASDATDRGRHRVSCRARLLDA